MRLMIASDIHGSAFWCEKLLKRFCESSAEKLLLLGDLLYHGPRNDLPEGYAPKQVIEMLNGIASKLLCVRGNCEAEVDQMVLRFPVMADYACVMTERQRIYLTHGHRYSPQNPLPMCSGDVMVFGHTHIPMYEVKDTYVFANPGSVSIPKNGTPRSVIEIRDDIWNWIDLSNNMPYKTESLFQGGI